MSLDTGNSFLDLALNTDTINYERLLNLTYETLDKLNINTSRKCINVLNLDDVINEVISGTQNHKKGLHDFLGLESKFYKTLSTNFEDEDKDKQLILK